jgi:hypothetical protein
MNERTCLVLKVSEGQVRRSETEDLTSAIEDPKREELLNRGRDVLMNDEEMQI